MRNNLWQWFPAAITGTTEITKPHEAILENPDTFTDRPGCVIANVPFYQDVTFFTRFGYVPMGIVAAVILLGCTRQTAAKSVQNIP